MNLQLRIKSYLITKSIYVSSTILRKRKVKEKESEIAKLCGLKIEMVVRHLGNYFVCTLNEQTKIN